MDDALKELAPKLDRRYSNAEQPINTRRAVTRAVAAGVANVPYDTKRTAVDNRHTAFIPVGREFEQGHAVAGEH